MSAEDPMHTERQCLWCARSYTCDEDPTADEIFCRQECRAADQAEHEAATEHQDPL